MKKIKSAIDIEKAQRRNNIILGGGMIVLLVLSMGGYSLMSRSGNTNSNKVSENGFNFIRTNGMWTLSMGNTLFNFRYLPSEVRDVPVNLSMNLTTYSGQPLYFVNPNDGMGDIIGNIGKYILRYQEACLRENSTQKCRGNLPTKNCNSNLIVFNNQKNTGVYEKDNCVFINGDTPRASDAFLYKLLGINHGN